MISMRDTCARLLRNWAALDAACCCTHALEEAPDRARESRGVGKETHERVELADFLKLHSLDALGPALVH
jgi:hypothetical protein